MGLRRGRALTARQIGELIGELAPRVAGARVRDVEGLPPRDLLLVLEVGERVERLRLSADPDASRLHRQLGRVRSHRGPVGPFFRAAKEALAGATVVSLAQEGGDRIARIRLRSGDATRHLVAELTGRHANLVLTDAEDRVTDVLIPSPPEREGSARLVRGEPWSPPPGRAAGGDPGPGVAEAFSAPADGDDAETPLSLRVEATLGAAAEERFLAAARKDLTARLKRKRKNAASLLRGLEQRRAACDGAERVRQDGELLKAHQGELKRGMTELEVDDWFTDGTPRRTLALEARLAPRENVERYFARYKKLLRTGEGLDADEARARETLERIDALLADEGDPATVEERALALGILKPRQAPGARGKRAIPAPRLPYRRFTACRGSEVRVGRTARDNDRLSLKECRGNDVWLHTRDAPGSHVVLRLEGRKDPDDEEVLDAAHLALHFSPLRGARKAAIHVARCKHVKKPKGAPPGLVTLSGGKTLQLRVEEDRLRRLLDARR